MDNSTPTQTPTPVPPPQSKPPSKPTRKPSKKSGFKKRDIVILISIVVFIALAVTLFVLVLSNRPDTTPEQDLPSSESPAQTAVTPPPVTEFLPEDIVEGGPTNPLTGQPMDVTKTRNRPLAIVLANTKAALPMNGISDADIVYEILVEGGITRMLALYQDIADMGKVGSIRSARQYTVELAESYDAILISAGASPQALREVRDLQIPHLNEVEGPHREIFFRDRNRIPGRRVESLHSVTTSGERVMEFLPDEYDFRKFHEDGYEQGLSFTDDATPQNGSNAVEVDVKFSHGKTTSFIYEIDKSGYRVNQFDMDLIDANDNSVPAFTNVLVLKTNVAPIPGDDSNRLNIITIGEGEGYFINGGKYVDIKWTRLDKSFPFIYTLADGSALDLGVGKTFICVIPTNLDATFK